jgi:5'-3' exonuclease
VRVHLLDGTYELFRHYFAVPKKQTPDGAEVGALNGVLGSVLGMLEGGVTHLAVATDHVIESFRNELWPGYKSSAGVPEDLLSQFWPLEDALRAMGVVVWAMTDVEADDALAAGAVKAAADKRVEQVLICTPDKDLGQCVTADARVVQYDRRNRRLVDRAAVIEKFGVPPESIADWLALVGDAADGYPGLPGWGAVSAGAVLARYGRIEDVPDDAAAWQVKVRGAERLARSLREGREQALLFRRLATLAADVPGMPTVDELLWRGPRPDFAATAASLDAPALAERATRIAAARFPA